MDSRVFLLRIVQTHPRLKRMCRAQGCNAMCSYPGAPRTVCGTGETMLECIEPEATLWNILPYIMVLMLKNLMEVFIFDNNF